jgi:hypothetical protein
MASIKLIWSLTILWYVMPCNLFWKNAVLVRFKGLAVMLLKRVLWNVTYVIRWVVHDLHAGAVEQSQAPFLDCLTLRMKALWFFEMLGITYLMSQHRKLEDLSLEPSTSSFRVDGAFFTGTLVLLYQSVWCHIVCCIIIFQHPVCGVRYLSFL